MAYANTLITPAADCRATSATVPPDRDPPSKAALEYALLTEAPGHYDHNSLNYAVYASQCANKGTTPQPADIWLKRGRPCLRASALTKTYGWGAFYGKDGTISLLDPDGRRFAALASEDSTTTLAAMRNRKAKAPCP